MLAAGALNAGAADFKVIAHYPIGGEVRYDYLRVDPDMRRLYVSHSTQVEVLDADTGAKLGVVGPQARAACEVPHFHTTHRRNKSY